MMDCEALEPSGGLLCDEMGLGKTYTTLGLLANAPVNSTLILGPLAVLRQWVTAAKDTPFAIYEMVKGQWTRAHGHPSAPRIYITNYDKLISNPSLFKVGFQRLVCDEAHILRNSKSEK